MQYILLDVGTVCRSLGASQFRAPNGLNLTLSHVDSLTLNVEWFDHVMVDQFKVLMADPVLHIAFAAGEEIVHHSHLMAIHHQLVSQVGSHKACTSGDLRESQERRFGRLGSTKSLLFYTFFQKEPTSTV